MKSIRKILLVMAALAAVFGFVACSDDDDGPSAVAVYENKETWTEGDVDCYDTRTAFFYDDKTFIVTLDYKDDEESWNIIYWTGVYTGDLSTDNTIRMTVKKVAWGDNDSLIDVPEASKDYFTNIVVFISDGYATINGAVYTKK